ncbi:MAG: insulinase family protein [Alphaproteobacteria bacterium]|nr:insulinase family protein [Alphaproteobacteria bacterium]
MRLRPMRSACAVLALCLTMAAGSARAAIFNAETFVLGNGMEVVVIPNHRSPVVSHQVWYRVGSADEPPGKTGIAHLLEHLMFKGTDKVPAGAYSRLVARNGGRDNAFTAFDYTGYYVNVAKDRLELAMTLEADRMVNLRLAEKDVLTERDVVLEERRSRTDNSPSALLNEQVRAALYLNHPLDGGAGGGGKRGQDGQAQRQEQTSHDDRHERPSLSPAGSSTPVTEAFSSSTLRAAWATCAAVTAAMRSGHASTSATLWPVVRPVPSTLAPV